MSVHDALYNGGIEYLLRRHKQSVTMAVIGYARVTGKTGMCIATLGSGATNLVTGLAGTLLDFTPVVTVTDQVASFFIRADASREMDVPGMSLSYTKHNFLVRSLGESPRIMVEALVVTNPGRSGLIPVGIPKDIQLVSGALEPYFAAIENVRIFLYVDAEQTRKMPAQAQKLILCVGGGVGMVQTVSALRELIAVTQTPIVCTLKGLGAVEADYPYYLGMLGVHGIKTAGSAMQECGLPIAASMRFDDRVAGKLNTSIPNASVIHIDIGPAETNKLRQAYVVL